MSSHYRRINTLIASISVLSRDSKLEKITDGVTLITQRMREITDSFSNLKPVDNASEKASELQTQLNSSIDQLLSYCKSRLSTYPPDVQT